MFVLEQNVPHQEETTLQPGDICVWSKRERTIWFERNGTRLRRHNGDDKFDVSCMYFEHHVNMITMIAEISNLTFKMKLNNKDKAVFRFE